MWRALIHVISEAVLRWFRYRDRRRREQAERAIVEGHKKQVNKDLDRLLRVLPFVLMLSSCGGCASYVVVPNDRDVAPIIHDGRRGWFVPVARMLEIYRALERAQN